MFSKLRAWVMIVALVMVGCSGEDQPYQTPPVVKMKESQCLDKADETFVDYLDGRLNAQQINAFWDCTQRALDIFLRFTQGRQVGIYSSQELRHFLHNFFLGELRINDTLLEEFMEIKRVFLAGSRDFVTRNELETTQVIIEDFRQLTIDLNPHIQVIKGEFYRHQRFYSVDELNRSLAALSDVLARFAHIIETRGQSYEFARFETLLTELNKLTQRAGNSRASFVQDLMPFVRQAKLQLVGSPADRIGAKQWVRLGTILAESFGLWMRAEHFTTHQGWASDPVMLEQAFDSMKSASTRLGQMFAQTDQVLEWPTIERLITDLDQLMKKHGSKKDLKQFVSWLPLFGEIKFQLVGGAKNAIGPDEWPQFMLTATRLAEVGLRYSHLVKPNDWSQGEGLRQLDRVVGLGMDVIDSALARKPKAVIPMAELKSLIASLDQAKVLPLKIRASSVEASLPALLHRLLRSPEDRLSGVKPEGLDQKTMAYLRLQWAGWKTAQDFANLMAIGKNPDPGDDSIKLEMKRVLAGPWPLVKDPKGRLVFKNVADMAWDQKSLTQMNWSRALLRLFVLGYAEERERADQLRGLNIDELDLLATDVRPIGVDMGIFKEGDDSLAERIHLEADLFMPRANGNELVDFEEGIEYLTFVLSGIDAGGELLAFLPKDCRNAEAGDERLVTSCFREHFGKERHQFLAHLPNFNAYVDTLAPEQWGHIQEYLETATRGDEGYSDKPIKTSDVREIFILLQYIETFFTRFNRDAQVLTINVEEALGAFPVFDLPLMNLLGFAERSDREALFTYMMKNGRPPPQDIDGLKLLQEWKDKKAEWSFEADRVRVVRILSELSKSL